MTSTDRQPTPWPRRTVRFTFPDGVERDVALFDAQILASIEDDYRRWRIERLIAAQRERPEGLEQPLVEPETLAERIELEWSRLIALGQVLDFIRTAAGLSIAVRHALLAANPDMDRDEAEALCRDTMAVGPLLPMLKDLGPRTPAPGAPGDPGNSGNADPHSPDARAAGAAANPTTPPSGDSS